MKRRRTRNGRHRQIITVLIAILITPIVCEFTEGLSRSILLSTYAALFPSNPAGDRHAPINTTPGTQDQTSGSTTSSAPKQNSVATIQVDELGVPIVDYGYIEGEYVGPQRNPVTVCNYAIHYYDSYSAGNTSARQAFLNCAMWLVNNAVDYRNGTYSQWEYGFPFPRYSMTPPWFSAMAHGRSLIVFDHAHELTNDSVYLQTAAAIQRSLFVEVSDGGVTYKTEDRGWWYEEYADVGGRESFVLNGMMYTLLGLYHHYHYTGDPDSLFLFDQGIQALKSYLPDYDMNGSSYYDLLGRPSGSYHSIHILLLNDLYAITGDPLFQAYRDHWQGNVTTDSEPQTTTSATQRAEPHTPFIQRLVLTGSPICLATFVANYIVVLAIAECILIVKTYIAHRSQRRPNPPGRSNV